MKIAVVLVVVLVTAACSGSEDGNGGGNGDDITPIAGIDWKLRVLSLDGVGVDLAGTTPTIRFDLPDQMGGTNGCNSYGGSYSLSQGRIAFGPMFQTEMGCPPAIASVETAFMTAIGRVDRMDTTPGVVVLSASDGSARLEFIEPDPVVDVPLQGSWILDSIGTAQGVSSIVAGTEPTLEITNATVRGSTGCNDFLGSLRWDADGSFVVSEMEWTEIACEPGIMRQEQSVLETLGDAANYEIEGDKLLVATDTGDRFLRYTAAS